MSLCAAAGFVAEGRSVRIFVELSWPTPFRTSIPIRVVEAGGSSLADYRLRDAAGASVAITDGRFSLTLEPGQTTQQFFVEATQDSIVETGEGLILALTDLPPGYVSGTEHTLTLPLTSPEDKELITCR